MICVTHEIGFARKTAARVIFMDAGDVIEEDDAVSFFDNPKAEVTTPFFEQVLLH